MRKTINAKIVEILIERKHRVIVASVGGMHVHALAELPNDRVTARREVGVAKKAASQAIAKTLPGRIWAKGCGLKPIGDEEHHRNTFGYIERHVEEGAFVWTFRDADPAG